MTDLNLGFSLSVFEVGRGKDFYPSPDMLGYLTKIFLLQSDIKSISLGLLTGLITICVLLTLTNTLIQYVDAVHTKFPILKKAKFLYLRSDLARLVTYKANFIFLRLFLLILVKTNFCETTERREKRESQGPSEFNLGGDGPTGGTTENTSEYIDTVYQTSGVNENLTCYSFSYFAFNSLVIVAIVLYAASWFLTSKKKLILVDKGTQGLEIGFSHVLYEGGLFVFTLA